MADAAPRAAGHLLLRGTECVRNLWSRDHTLSGKNPWVALYTRSRHEKRVARGLDERGFDNYLPLVPIVSHWHDRKKTVYWPLFPGYVFARLPESSLSALYSVPGVVSVVSVAGAPATIPDEEILNVRKVAEAIRMTGSGPKPEVLVREGEPVIVTDGAFHGVQGRVLEHRGSRITLLVGVSAIGQGVRLEVPEDSVRGVSRTVKSS